MPSSAFMRAYARGGNQRGLCCALRSTCPPPVFIYFWENLRAGVSACMQPRTCVWAQAVAQQEGADMVTLSHSYKHGIECRLDTRQVALPYACVDGHGSA